MDELLRHKKDIDKALQKMSVQWRREWGKQYTPATLVVLDSLIEFLNRGGKRVRGALAMESYYLHGGTDKKVAIGAACVVELVQAYLLIVDDIQDQSVMRRGGQAVHVQLAAGNSAHYGVAQGLNAQMLASHKAMSQLLQLPVEPMFKLRAAELLSYDVGVTIVGQINDIYNQTTGFNSSDKAIIATMTWKTAYYTFVSPLELGACLAGANGLSRRLKRYAINAGIAFQISDDVLGVFGETFEVGKSWDDDIREGKATLMTHFAFSNASPSQQKTLRQVLGNAAATEAECTKVRTVLEQTGALAHAKKIAGEYALAAETALGKNAEDFLIKMVRFAVSRRQ